MRPVAEKLHCNLRLAGSNAIEENPVDSLIEIN